MAETRDRGSRYRPHGWNLGAGVTSAPSMGENIPAILGRAWGMVRCPERGRNRRSGGPTRGFLQRLLTNHATGSRWRTPWRIACSQGSPGANSGLPKQKRKGLSYPRGHDRKSSPRRPCPYHWAERREGKRNRATAPTSSTISCTRLSYTCR